jgi:hypothetical protein
VPLSLGENREAGEIPARSRHCDDNSCARVSKSGDLPGCLAAFGTLRGKVFRPPDLRVPLIEPVPYPHEQEVGGIFAFNT